MRHADDPDFEAHKASFAPLDGVLDLEALTQARAEAPQLLPLTGPKIDGLTQRPIPDIGSIDRRRSQARRDLRRGLEVLRPRPQDAREGNSDRSSTGTTPGDLPAAPSSGPG